MQAGQLDTCWTPGGSGAAEAPQEPQTWHVSGGRGYLNQFPSPCCPACGSLWQEDLPPRPLVQKNTEGSRSLWGVTDAGGSWSPGPEGTFPEAA